MNDLPAHPARMVVVLITDLHSRDSPPATRSLGGKKDPTGPPPFVTQDMEYNCSV